MSILAILSCIFCGFPFPACLGAFGCPDCAAGDELDHEEPHHEELACE